MIITKKYVNDLTYKIVGAAIEVHKILGPGLLESGYEAAFIKELALRGFKSARQQRILIDYKGEILDTELRLDVLVEDLIVCELKVVKALLPVHEATLMSYMKHLQRPKGILFNFYVQSLYHEGTKTFVNEYFTELPEA